MSIKWMIRSNHLILCCPWLLLPSIFLSIRVFSNELALCIRWPGFWSFNFSILPSNEYLWLISFKIDWFDLLAVQGMQSYMGTSHGRSESDTLSSVIFSGCLMLHGREGDGTPLQYSCLENPTGWRSLVGCSPWGRKESDTTERLHLHFPLACIGEGNGTPLQCSCLENPRGSRAWWAAICGVAQSRTRLKRLSSSSSNASWGLPWWLMGKESTYNTGDTGEASSIPGSGRSPGEENGNPLQYSCLENSVDRGAWRAVVHGVTKSWTQLGDWAPPTHTHRLRDGS